MIFQSTIWETSSRMDRSWWTSLYIWIQLFYSVASVNIRSKNQDCQILKGNHMYLYIYIYTYLIYCIQLYMVLESSSLSKIKKGREIYLRSCVGSFRFFVCCRWSKWINFSNCQLTGAILLFILSSFKCWRRLERNAWLSSIHPSALPSIHLSLKSLVTTDLFYLSKHTTILK